MLTRNQKQIIKSYVRPVQFFYIKLKNKISLKKKVSNKFLFIISPPFCGSTLLNEIISTSSNVSVNNPYGTMEGQALPEVINMMLDRKVRWDPNAIFNWPFIKQQWMKYWDISKPVLLEKSPSTIVRALNVEKYFEPVYFILFLRNPYAHCESLMRRNKSTPTKAAQFAIDSLIFQNKNINNLKKKLVLTYEKLTDDPEKTIAKLGEFMPELKDCVLKNKFHAHNYKQKHIGISNLNDEKIKTLSKSDLIEINKVFEPYKSLIVSLNYSLIRI